MKQSGHSIIFYSYSFILVIGRQVSEAFSYTELSGLYKSCQVLYFRSDIGWVTLITSLLINNIIDQKGTSHQIDISNQSAVVPIVVMNNCNWSYHQSGQRGCDLWPLVQSFDRCSGGGAAAGGRAWGGPRRRMGHRHKQHPGHRWVCDVTVRSQMSPASWAHVSFYHLLITCFNLVQ